MGKHYDQEYKDYVSKLVVEEGREATEVANELEIPNKTLCRWVAAYKKSKKDKQRKTILPLHSMKKKYSS